MIDGVNTKMNDYLMSSMDKSLKDIFNDGVFCFLTPVQLM